MPQQPPLPGSPPADVCELPTLAALDAAEGRPQMRPAYTAAGPGATEALDLWGATSSLPLRRRWAAIPATLHPYLQHLYAAAGQPLHAAPSVDTSAWAELADDGTCWVQFTGGKDSTAAALQAEAAGYQPVCWHLAGINRGMGDERHYAAALCEARGWPLLVDRVTVHGKKQGVTEPPAKNQVAALLLLARMAERGGAAWAAGWHAEDEQSRQTFGYDWTDGTEAIRQFSAHLAARYPGQRYTGTLHGTVEAWAEVAAAGLLQYVKGCVCPPRYKRRVRAANERRYGPLLAGRCGSCVKCAWEQVALEALGVIPPHPELRAHGGRWLIRDMAGKLQAAGQPTPTLADVEAFLVPAGDVRRWRRPRAEWPAQPPPPGAEHEGL